METNSRSVFKQALIYGVFTAVASIVFSLIMYIADVPFKSPLMYLGIAILLIGLVMGILNYRNKFLGGYIDFGKAFLVGFLIIAIAALINSIYTWLFYGFFDPAAHAKIVDTAMEQAELNMIEQGTPSEQMDMGLEMARKFMSPGALAIMGFLGNLLYGAILAIIAALILKKTDKSFEGAVKNVN